MKTIVVHAPTKTYPILICDSLAEAFGLWLKDHAPSRAAVVTNPTVWGLHGQTLRAALDEAKVAYGVIEIGDGEEHKNLKTVSSIYDALLSEGAGRDALVIAFGGGVVGDAAGFAAATYQRGAPFLQVPTTLLSQVDSSVGGKTGVNHPLGKNMIGAFWQPEAVLIGADALRTLPARQLSSGLGEVVKYGLLGDVEFLGWLEARLSDVLALKSDALERVIATSCSMKAKIVARDETERGARALLNLGHTFGHAIEARMGYGQWLHGEAVGAGMVLAARLSQILGDVGSDDVLRVQNVVKAAGLPVEPPRIPIEDWLSTMSHDKKARNGKARFVTFRALGDAVVRDDVPEEAVRDALAPYL